MDKSQVRNFILLVLLLVNLFLLALVLADKWRASAEQQDAWEEMSGIFLQNGITLEPGVRAESVPESYSLRRDTERELELAQRLLGGSVSGEPQGGDIYCYTGDNGQASFHGNGDFDVSFEPDAADEGKDFLGTAADVLRKLEIDYDPDSAQMKPDEGCTVVSLTVVWQSKCVYNSRVSFRFFEDSLISMTGRRMLDTVLSVGGRAGMDQATLLMRFLRVVREGGYVCTKISAISPGYSMNDAASNDAVLVPVWRIETDAGAYYINGITGKEEIIA
jgi:hypothetical protein